MGKQDQRTKRLSHTCKALEERFLEVEQVGVTRFLVWGSPEFKHRPYIEIWFDQDSLDQEESDFQAYIQRIVTEAEEMLTNPDQVIRKQGEILVSGMNGITVRRGSHIYHLSGIHDDIT
jgi:hypothetical protein